MIVITGAAGMLGRAFAARLRDRGEAFVATDVHDLDLEDSRSLAAGIHAGVTTVINCAAYTNVDRAESEEARALALNGDAVGRLVARCDEVGARLVHFSTDYVFDGKARAAPYAIDTEIRPINAYGRTKAAGEAHVQASPGQHILLRTSWLYAPWGTNFVRTIARLANERDTLSVVDDQRGRPSSAEEVARVSLALLDAEASGTFHVSDSGECTWFDFAVAIAESVAPSCRVTPTDSASFVRPAARPAYSVLDLSRTEALVGPLLPWREALASVLARLEPDHAAG